MFLSFLFFLQNRLATCTQVLSSTVVFANGTKITLYHDNSNSAYEYFTIRSPPLTYPVNIAISITLKTLPNILDIFQGTPMVKYPNASTLNYMRQYFLSLNNGTASFDIDIYNPDDLFFGLNMTSNSEIIIYATASEITKQPIWKTILFVVMGIVSVGALMLFCYKFWKYFNACLEKLADCADNSWYFITSRIRKPCRKRAQTHVIRNESGPRIILVASMPDPGRFRFENRAIPGLVDHVEKIIEPITAAEEENIQNLPDDFICSVCMIRKKTMMFEPCKHICCCSKCTKEIIILQKKCPLCREVISDVKLAMEL